MIHSVENTVRYQVPVGGTHGTAPVSQGAHGILGSAVVGVWHTKQKQSPEVGEC